MRDGAAMLFRWSFGLPYSALRRRTLNVGFNRMPRPATRAISRMDSTNAGAPLATLTTEVSTAPRRRCHSVQHWSIGPERGLQCYERFPQFSAAVRLALR